MKRFVLALYTTLAVAALFLTGCGPCFPGGQPECAASHRVDVTDGDGQPLSRFTVRLVVDERSIDESVDCGDAQSVGSVYLRCYGDDSGRIEVHAFGEHPAQITITTEDGRSVSQTVVLKMRGGDEDGCSCPAGDELSVQVD